MEAVEAPAASGALEEHRVDLQTPISFLFSVCHGFPQKPQTWRTLGLEDHVSVLLVRCRGLRFFESNRSCPRRNYGPAFR